MSCGNFFPTKWMNMSVMKQLLFDTTVLWLVCSMEKDNGSPVLFLHTSGLFTHGYWACFWRFLCYFSIREALGLDRRVRKYRLRPVLGGSSESKETDDRGSGCGINNLPDSLWYVAICIMSHLSLSLIRLDALVLSGSGEPKSWSCLSTASYPAQ